MRIVLLIIFSFPIETVSFSTIRQHHHHSHNSRARHGPRNVFSKEQQSFVPSVNRNKNHSSSGDINGINGSIENINVKSSSNRRKQIRSTATAPAGDLDLSNTPSRKKKSSDANSLTKLVVLIIPLTVILTLAMNESKNDNNYSLVSQEQAQSAPTERVSTKTGKEKILTTIEEQRRRQQSESELNLVLESVESLGTNILEAAIPQDATTLLSVTLGESFAGVLGAIATWGVNLGLMGDGSTTSSIGDETMMGTNTMYANTNRRRNEDSDVDFEGDSLSSNDIPWWKQNSFMNKNNGQTNKDVSSGTTKKSPDTGVDLLFTEAVADSDYFVTRAVATPLLGAVGMSGGIASALTVLLATVPYQFIKFTAKAKEQKIKEDAYFDTLLKIQKRDKKNKLFKFSPMTTSNTMVMGIPMPPMPMSTFTKEESSLSKTTNNPGDKEKAEDTEPPMEMGYRFDFVELFADICKWLEYDVLVSDFGGMVALNAGFEGAIFGTLAALSSQIYADIIYRFSDFGPKSKRKEIKERSLEDYFRIYWVKGFSAATLFGVYEIARQPLTKVINNVLSGGYDSCLGSDDFNFCLETYFFANPAEATPEAQLRSFAVALVNLVDRLGDIQNIDVDAAVRSLAVQLYNLI